MCAEGSGGSYAAPPLFWTLLMNAELVMICNNSSAEQAHAPKHARDELQNKTLRRNRAVAGHGLYDARRRQSQVTTISWLRSHGSVFLFC